MPRTISTTSIAAGSRRNRGILMLAALFGVLSAALLLAFMNSRGGGDDLDKALNSGASESVVVVTRDIPAGTQVTPDMVTVASVPTGALLAGRIQTQEDVIGKVTTAPLYKDEQVVLPKITTFEGQNTLAYKIPDGMRGIGLQVPHEAWIVGGLLQPGDRVDVIGLTTLSRTDPLTGSERPDVVAGIVAQNVEVLAASQTVVRKVVNTDQKKASQAPGAAATPSAEAGAVVKTDNSGDPLDNPDTYEKAISVTLALPPELAAKVSIIDAMKDDVGQYRLVLRQKGDDTQISGTVLWSFEEVFKK